MEEVLQLIRSNVEDEADLSDTTIPRDKLQKLCEALRHNTSLRRLYIAGAGLGDDGLLQIVEALPRCVTELFAGRNGVTDEGARQILTPLATTSLTTLQLGKKGLSTETLERIDEVLKANTGKSVPGKQGDGSSHKPGQGWCPYTTPGVCQGLLREQQRLAQQLQGVDVPPPHPIPPPQPSPPPHHTNTEILEPPREYR
eukprot:Sspe_Gene.28444::Locus_12910_Transcript_1_1_Confidence_1.000_Length_2347::g.28444::m.28444